MKKRHGIQSRRVLPGQPEKWLKMKAAYHPHTHAETPVRISHNSSAVSVRSAGFLLYQGLLKGILPCMQNYITNNDKMIRKLAFVLMLCVLCSVFSIGHCDAAASTQSILLTGVGNARELGGYKTEDGRTVRHGILLRTAKLSGAKEEDIQRLISEYHLAVVVDFRGDMEIEKIPDPIISSARNLNLQIMDEDNKPSEEMAAEVEALMSGNGEISKLDMLRLAIRYGTFTDQIYADFLSSDKGKAGYRQFFDELLALPDG